MGLGEVKRGPSAGETEECANANETIAMDCQDSSFKSSTTTLIRGRHEEVRRWPRRNSTQGLYPGNFIRRLTN
jgi:hypothetical protein